MSEPVQKPRRSAAAIIAAGIFVSRIIGFLRERAVAHFFGVSVYTDVFQAAFRGPNLLQNLLGEGTISAAFIPIYSRLLSEGREEDAGRFAGAIFGLLTALTVTLVALGVVFARPLTALLVPGWTDDPAKFELTVRGVYIIFPMTGILVLSAWALGILNSHRRFFMPYFAPVLWNVAIIVGMMTAAFLLLDTPLSIPGLDAIPGSTQERILFAAFWGALAGGVLQFLVQLPLVMRLMRGFRISLDRNVPGVREAGRAFGPVVAGRGVYQLSGYLDMFLASFLATGAVGLLRYSQMLYTLPISLFGISVAAAELPELARVGPGRTDIFIERMNRSVRQMLFLTIPTTIGFLAFGFLVVGLLLRTGSFTVNANWLVYFVLAAYTLGLLATTMTRLMQNAFYALNDTRTPAKVAVYRVLISTAVAVPLMFLLDRVLLADLIGVVPQEQPLYMGTVGLALGAAVGSWTELWSLDRSLHRRLGHFRLPWGAVAQMGGVALGAAAVAGALWWLLPDTWHVALTALIVLSVYGLGYGVLAHLAGIPETAAFSDRFLRRFKRKG